MNASRTGPFRNEDSHRAVLQATSELMGEVGYDRLTMEGIARRAGVAKQTIYRWWPSRSAVVAEALIEGLVLPDLIAVPNTGDLRSDLDTWLSGLAELIDDPVRVAMMRSVITASMQAPEIASRMRELLMPTVALSERLAPPTTDGRTVDAPVGTLIDMIFGALLVHVISRTPLDRPAIDGLIGAVAGQG